MKNLLNYRFIFLLLVSIFLFSSSFQNLNAQNAKKNKVRLKADYVKIMNEEVYFNIRATSRIGKKNTNVSNIDVTVYNEFDDDKVELGTITTDMKGSSKFVVKDFNSLKADSTNTYNILISFKGNEEFSKASKRITFRNANIEAKLITKDSINYITAKLLDASKDSLISDASLTVQVQRLFQPLFIGDEFNITDEYGTISVPIEKGIPGIDGNLNIEVVLDAHDDFGTVKAIVIAPIGTPIIDESTFDKRTMWSPRNKTPIFLLIFPNLIIFGMWGLIVYLIYNLFKISKHKNIKI
ncbi:MAG: hypothetical protein DRI75_05900 [Bacteroidetes bacterium]|nr:MAG: hypothetical protein DRI75_05900 [Bacteroidota bacterium]